MADNRVTSDGLVLLQIVLARFIVSVMQLSGRAGGKNPTQLSAESPDSN